MLRTIPCVGSRTAISVIIALLSVGCSREDAYPQTAGSPNTNTIGCQLTEWMSQLPPHSTRTPELPQELRDTVVTLGTSNNHISIPDGFTITPFARLGSARGLTLSPEGVIYATSYDGSVYALPDHNHDGKADSTIKVASGLGDPHGIGFFGNDLFVSNNGTLYKLTQIDANRVSHGMQAIMTFSGGHIGHYSRNFVFDTTNRKVYLQVGSTGNMGPDTNDSLRATVLEANIDGSNKRVYSRGLRNAVGMDIDPRTGAIWVNNNGMDNLFGTGTALTNDNPSECVYMLCDGANFGWPWAYGYQMRNPTAGFNNIDTNLIRSFSGPVGEVLAHSAPLGLHFYRGAVFPAKYHNAIFQTYHGSWNRNPPAPPRVTVMWADADGRNAKVQDFINGFQKDSSANAPRWGRPVSVIEGADSALYISDDAAGYIYRVQWTGPTQTNLFIDSRNLTNQSFHASETVPIYWTSNNVDSVDIYFSANNGVWQRVGGARTSPYMMRMDFSSTTNDRIRLVDARSGIESISDGGFSIGSLGVAELRDPVGLTIQSTSPNPSTRSSTLRYSLKETANVRIELCSILGTVESLLLDNIVAAGEHTIEIPTTTLAQGSYIVRVTSRDAVQSTRLVVER